MVQSFLPSCAALAAAALAQLCLATGGLAQGADKPMVTLQPDPSSEVKPFYRDFTQHPELEPHLSRDE